MPGPSPYGYGMPGPSPYGYPPAPGMPPAQYPPTTPQAQYPAPGMPPAQYPAPGQQAQQAPNGDNTGSGRAGDRKSRSRSRDAGVADFPDWPDDKSKLGTSYRTLGMSWLSGERKAMTKKFRMQMVNSCDPLRFPMMTLAQLTCEQLDLLLYIVTGISPATRPHDFGASCKRDARRMCRQQHLQKLKRQPGRMDQLTDELDNLPVVAMRLGYQPEWLSPALRQAFIQSRSAMNAPPAIGSGTGCNGGGAPPALVAPAAVAPVAPAAVAPGSDALHGSAAEGRAVPPPFPQGSPLKLTNEPHLEVPANAAAFAAPMAAPDAEGVAQVACAGAVRPSGQHDGRIALKRHPGANGAWCMPSMKFANLGVPASAATPGAQGDDAAGVGGIEDDAGHSGRHQTSPCR